MGLDFSHGDAHWSYSGFHRFRNKLAQQARIELSAMDGYGGEESWELHQDDPLVILLNHSDCDGEIAVSDCLKLAARIRELVANWPDAADPYDKTVDDYDKVMGLKLAEGLENAASEGVALRFC